MGPGQALYAALTVATIHTHVDCSMNFMELWSVDLRT